MKSLIKITLMFLVFTVEVRVRASHPEIEHKNLIQEPQGCLNVDSLCALYNKSSQFQVPLEGQKVILGSKTGIVRESGEQIQFLKGIAYLSTDANMKIKTEFGDLILKNAAVLLNKTKGQVNFVCLKGHLRYQPKGEKDQLILPPAYENYMEAVTESGSAQSGFSKAANVKKWIPIWSKVFDGTSDEFKTQVLRFKESWQVAVEQAPEWYRGLVDRRLAEAEADRKHQAALRKKRYEKNKHFRELFRKKNYIF